MRGILNIEKNEGKFIFDTGLNKTSPGQACVFYSKSNFGEKVLGGGWIDRTTNNYLST